MRAINRVIIHCSATPEGRNVSAEDIRRWHLARGWSDIGYHYVIELDGTVKPGRCISRIGAGVRGHNRDSVHICYVGGLDRDGKPKNTITPGQRLALRRVCKALCRVLMRPLSLHGHNEYAAKACPSFNVSTELSTLAAFLAEPGRDCVIDEG